MKSAGVDFEEAEKSGIKTVVASGLPGKIAPVTAGEIMYRCIASDLSERGYAI